MKWIIVLTILFFLSFLFSLGVVNASCVPPCESDQLCEYDNLLDRDVCRANPACECGPNIGYGNCTSSEHCDGCLCVPPECPHTDAACYWRDVGGGFCQACDASRECASYTSGGEVVWRCLWRCQQNIGAGYHGYCPPTDYWGNLYTCDNNYDCCQYESCESMGYECGGYDTGCDLILDCGSCQEGYDCVDNNCTCTETLESQCSGKECGLVPVCDEQVSCNPNDPSGGCAGFDTVHPSWSYECNTSTNRCYCGGLEECPTGVCGEYPDNCGGVSLTCDACPSGSFCDDSHGDWGYCTGCVDSCDIGSYDCVDSTRRLCQDDDGCGSWIDVEICQFGCDGTACSDVCVNSNQCGPGLDCVEGVCLPEGCLSSPPSAMEYTCGQQVPYMICGGESGSIIGSACDQGTCYQTGPETYACAACEVDDDCPDGYCVSGGCVACRRRGTCLAVADPKPSGGDCNSADDEKL